MNSKFIVYGEPVAKGRPKFSRQGNFVRSYTPAKTTNYENLVKLAYMQECEGIKLGGKIKADIKAFFPIPKSIPKKKLQSYIDEQEYKVSKPDCDNLAKSVLDALNQIAYEDDNQVVILNVEKKYSQTPRVEVELLEIE